MPGEHREEGSGVVVADRSHPRLAGAGTACHGRVSVLARFLVKNPEELRVLASEPEPRRGNWLEYIRSRVVDEAGQADADRLRRANHAALVEIAARDLACDDPIALVDDIAAELSHLADAILECALDCARASVPESTSVRLAVIAMGKTGARELNYISDVDVIYVAEPAGDAGHEEAMCAGAKVAAAVARICSAHTAEGTIWPVDAALRPEGNAGPLVRSLESCAAYYRQWAKNWEFQALLKARPAAGDKELGQAFWRSCFPARLGSRPASGFPFRGAGHEEPGDIADSRQGGWPGDKAWGRGDYGTPSSRCSFCSSFTAAVTSGSGPAEPSTLCVL